LPVHTVTLDSFVMGRYEISNEQYCAFLKSAYPSQLMLVGGVVYASGDTANSFPYCDTSSHSPYSQIAFSNNTFSVQTKGGRDMSKDPMVCVSWYGAVAYCNWRSQREGKPICYDLSTWVCDFSKNGYRLPTEAEWEYAARGGLSGQRFPLGMEISHLLANYQSNWDGGKPVYPYDVSTTMEYHPLWNDGIEPYTSPVGSFLPNGFGPYDMDGNVWEWCNDWYDSSYYSNSLIAHPTGPATGSDRVLRGSAWRYSPLMCRVACRNYGSPSVRSMGVFPEDLVIIPAGTFQMGNSTNIDEGYSDELPVHTVTLDSFAMGKYEITNGQYRDFLNSALAQGLVTVTSDMVYQAGSGTSYPYCDTSTTSYNHIDFSNDSFSVRTKGGRDMSNDPMVYVSWYGAVAYCNWRSQQEGKQACYDLSTWTCDFTKNGYRLPTEAEWEYAARGGLSGKRFPWGDTINQTQANFYSHTYSYDVSPVKNQYHPLWNDGQDPYTSPVGFFDGSLKYKAQYNWPGSATSYQTTSGANGYGLYDMAGNVWEWCHDWYGDYSSSSQINQTGPATGSYRVLRGGSWSYDHVSICRVSFRGYDAPYLRRIIHGFRIVLDF
jgi:formylglycine-generating enzyme required for sulfatase activity